ncbi:hypothetical protein [Lacrimispora indolis]|uniref:hypothetical protein n=1 Tax=Lacrimispora indolis TaxID=69825 RepID=UPI00041FFAE2|nr:hypothetical protein [[Clostridium] methoxybenzovorans]
MFALVYKELYIVKEPMRKNCTCQSWRGKQIALCEDKQTLQKIIESKTDTEKEKYYIEEMGF